MQSLSCVSILTGLAVGASGKNQYEFELVFCDAINSEVGRVMRSHDHSFLSNVVLDF